MQPHTFSCLFCKNLTCPGCVKVFQICPKKAAQFKREQHHQSAGKSPESIETLFLHVLHYTELLWTLDSLPQGMLSCPPPPHPPPIWNNPFSPLLGFWHLKYAWPLVLFSAFPGTVKDAKGVISMFPLVLRLIVERLEVERTPMRSSLTSPGSNLGLFLCILLSGALSSSAVTWFKPQSSQSVPRAGKSQPCVSYCQETFPDIQPKFSFP